MFNERDPRWPQPSKAEDLIEPNPWVTPKRRDAGDLTQVIEKVKIEGKHAARKIQRNFRQHLKDNKLNKLIALKPLEEILVEAGSYSRYSVTALQSLIGSHYLKPTQDITERGNNKKGYSKGLRESQRFERKQDGILKDSSVEYNNPDNILKYFLGLKPNLSDRSRQAYHHHASALLKNSAKDCGDMARILRALLVNNLQPDILYLIGGRTAIRLWHYEPIDHEFIVVKNFYGEEDTPRNHLVMDSWLQHCYLPETKGYRSESKYPASYKYYERCFLDFIKDKQLSDIVKGFEHQAINDKHKRRRGYMGPLDGYQEFLVNHADGVYTVIDPDSQYEDLRKSCKIPSTSISKDYFKTVPAPVPRDSTYDFACDEGFYDFLYEVVTQLMSPR